MEHLRTSIKIALILFCGIFIMSCNSSTTKETEEFLLLPPNEFDQRLTNEKNPQVIDVRTPAEFSEGTMMYAVNYNLLDSTLHRNLSNLDSNKTVFVFCQKGGRSEKASALLKEKGFRSIIDLKGGMDAWYKSDPIK